MLEGPGSDEFTAPAGALTLLLVSGWRDREALLELLETSRYSGLCELIEERDEHPTRTLGPGDREARMTSPAQLDRLRFVAATLERWLRTGESPGHRPPEAEAIAAMACCWSAAVTHALAMGPQTIAELARAVPSLYGEDIAQEHVEALERTSQARSLPGGGEARYALTEWGMEAIAPLIAAAHYETAFPQVDVMPPEILDAEATFQLAAPLIRLPADLYGTCRLSVRLPDDDSVLAGATVEVRQGRIVASSILLEREPETWVTGLPRDWCEAVVDPAAAQLEFGGDADLAGALLEALHQRLFGEPKPGRSVKTETR